MNIGKNQFEVLTYIEREGGKKISQREIAGDLGLSLGVVNKTLTELVSIGLVAVNYRKEIQLTKLGAEALEPYRVKRAVIIAAGFGSRMVPVTLNTPKPLVRVHGKMIIETLLDAVVKAGISEIVLVRGYLWEQFDVLRRKYPEIKFLHNPIYNESNNISSVYRAKELLENAYICEADLLLSNPALIRKYEYNSNYLGVYKDYTDDWCFEVKNGYISNMKIGGRECYHMYGISYWSGRDGARLAKAVDESFHMPGGKEKFWDVVALQDFRKDFRVEVRPCKEGDIIEIDTFNELKKIDAAYNQ